MKTMLDKVIVLNIILDSFHKFRWRKPKKKYAQGNTFVHGLNVKLFWANDVQAVAHYVAS